MFTFAPHLLKSMNKIQTARKMLLDYLKEQIAAKNLTQEQVAEKTGFATSSVNRMLNAHYPPTLDNFISLCEAANCYVFIIDKDADDDLCETMRNRWGKPNLN
jgi:transcriptional regulator with XRE-family HTH domain